MITKRLLATNKNPSEVLNFRKKNNLLFSRTYNKGMYKCIPDHSNPNAPNQPYLIEITESPQEFGDFPTPGIKSSKQDSFFFYISKESTITNIGDREAYLITSISGQEYRSNTPGATHSLLRLLPIGSTIPPAQSINVKPGIYALYLLNLWDYDISDSYNSSNKIRVEPYITDPNKEFYTGIDMKVLPLTKDSIFGEDGLYLSNENVTAKYSPPTNLWSSGETSIKWITLNTYIANSGLCMPVLFYFGEFFTRGYSIGNLRENGVSVDFIKALCKGEVKEDEGFIGVIPVSYTNYYPNSNDPTSTYIATYALPLSLEELDLKEEYDAYWAEKNPEAGIATMSLDDNNTVNKKTDNKPTRFRIVPNINLPKEEIEENKENNNVIDTNT